MQLVVTAGTGVSRSWPGLSQSPAVVDHLRAGAESYWKGEAREAVGRELFSSERLPYR